MLILAAHNGQHTLPAVLGFLGLMGSLALGLFLVLALRGRSRRVVAAVAALSLAAVSYGWLKAESDTWWNRRCHSDKPGCGDRPPIVPFTNEPRD